VCIIMCNITYLSIGHRFSKRRELSAAVDVCSCARALFVYMFVTYHLKPETALQKWFLLVNLIE